MLKANLEFSVASLLLLFLASCAVTQPPVPVASLNREAAREMKKEKGYWIEVQIPQRKLVLAKGDHIIKVFPVAVGMPVFPTPVGLRSINSVVWNPWWHPPEGSSWVTDPTPVPPRTPENPLGEVKMPMGAAYLIHGTKAVYSIGQWASHGCIRMLFEDIFGLVQLLLTEYSDASAVDEMEKANRDPHTEMTTKLNHDIPVVLTYDLVKVREGYVSIAPDFYNRQTDLTGHVAHAIRPYLKGDEKVSEKKVKNLLKIFKNRTIYVPLESIVN